MKKLIFFLSIILSYNSIGQCFMSNFSNGMKIELSSGNKNLDYLIHQEELLLESFFGLNINIYYGLELNQNGNAFFSPFCPNIYFNGEIVLGKFLMLECANKSDGHIRLKGIFAHEFAHGLQHKFGWSGRSKWRELHADYLAGYYIGKRGG